VVLKSRGTGHNDWLEGIGDERFLAKLFEFESDGIFGFGGWRENCIEGQSLSAECKGG